MTKERNSDNTFLEHLGQRVRTVRDRRSMSRKLLARVSGISERYIAQLESGKANVSIVLLRRISGAMDVPLEDMFLTEEPRQQSRDIKTSVLSGALNITTT